MKQTDFTVENKLPLPAVFFLIIVSIKEIVKQLWALFALLVAQGFKNRTGLLLKIALVVVLLLAIAVIRGVLLYLNFRYVVKNNELIVKKGILKKTVLTIPLHRIQNISITQGFWQQMLDITTLCVDTAGTDDKEMEIYLDIVTSNALKEFLNTSRNEMVENESFAETMPNPFPPHKKKKYIYVYTAKELVIAAFSRNHIKGFGIFIALVYAFMMQLGETLMRRILDTVDPEVLAAHSPAYWLFIVVSVFLVSVLVNFVHICLKYYGLTATLYDDSIKYSGGLIKKMEKIISLDKIQIIRETTNLLEKMLNVSSVKLLQFLTFGKEAKSEVTVVLPGFRHSKQLTDQLYNELNEEEFAVFYPRRNYLYRNFYFYALYPSLLIGLVSFLNINVIFFAVSWLAIGTVCAYFRFRKSKAEVGNKYIRISSGMLGNIISTIKIKNIQSVTLKQSVFQKRRQNASVIIATRWDHLIIPFVKEADAKHICNYLLYKIES